MRRIIFFENVRPEYGSTVIHLRLMKLIIQLPKRTISEKMDFMAFETLLFVSPKDNPTQRNH